MEHRLEIHSDNTLHRRRNLNLNRPGHPSGWNYCLAKGSPRLPNATIARSRAPLLAPEFEVRGRLRRECEERMRYLANLHTIKNRVADQNCAGQSTVQRGNRIIVIDTFFATPFSDLFQAESMRNFLCDRRIYKR